MKRLVYAFALLLAVQCVSDVYAGEKRRRERNEKEVRNERAMLGDPIGYAIVKKDDLQLNAQQVTFLRDLKKKMQAEREKDKDEQSVRQIFMDAQEARKKDPTAARAQREMYRTLAQAQAQKWEEREMKELEKLLPKATFAKFKELRGEVEAEIDNPFGD